jgi:hypothetical protein
LGHVVPHAFLPFKYAAHFRGRSCKKDFSMLSKLCASALVVGLPMSAIAATPGARPGDEAMTCAMIAQELQPGAMVMSGAMAPEMARVQKQGNKRAKEGQAEFKRRSATAIGCAAGAIATMGAVDPCAAINAAEDANAAAQAPRRAAEDKAMMGDMNAMMANMNRSMAGMDQARIQRLMALAEAKNCREP